MELHFLTYQNQCGSVGGGCSEEPAKNIQVTFGPDWMQSHAY